MIGKAVQLYCGNEHGFGDVTFPADGIFNPDYSRASTIRAAAKKAGWGVVDGEDYCDICMESFREEVKQKQEAEPEQKPLLPGL